MLEKWTNTSLPPSREMNPKPFSALKNFTVPVVNCLSSHQKDPPDQRAAATLAATPYRSGVSSGVTSTGPRVPSDSIADSTTCSAAKPSHADGPTVRCAAIESSHTASSIRYASANRPNQSVPMLTPDPPSLRTVVRMTGAITAPPSSASTSTVTSYAKLCSLNSTVACPPPSNSAVSNR